MPECSWCSGTGRDFRAEADTRRLNKGFVECSKCGGSGRAGLTLGVESEPQTDMGRYTSALLDVSLPPKPRALYHHRMIHEEVEAMDWPDVLGE